MNGSKQVLVKSIILFLIIVLFNTLAFILSDGYDANFWCGYAFITLAWACLAVAFISPDLGKNDKNAGFLTVPGMVIAIAHFLIQLAFGIAVMALPYFSMKADACIQIAVLVIYLIIYLLLEIYKDKNEN